MTEASLVPLPLSSPLDGVSSLRFHPDANYSSFLAISSWDSSIRLFDTEPNQELLHMPLNPSAPVQVPILDLQWSKSVPTHLYASCADGSICTLDLENPEPALLSKDPKGMGIRSLQFHQEHNLLFAGSWSGNLLAIDPRVGGAPVSVAQLTDPQTQQTRKILSMALSEGANGNPARLIAGTTGRGVYLFDLRHSLKRIEQYRESSLLHQTRSIAAIPNGAGYAISSVEGRIAIEYFDTREEVQKMKYAFKCHRQNGQKDGKTLISSVNSLMFHPVYGSLLSAGSDGMLAVWDIDVKKRICQYPRYPNSIAATSFNSDGSLLAVASSYGWEKGETAEADKEKRMDQVFLRTIQPAEVKPKGWKQ